MMEVAAEAAVTLAMGAVKAPPISGFRPMCEAPAAILDSTPRFAGASSPRFARRIPSSVSVSVSGDGGGGGDGGNGAAAVKTVAVARRWRRWR
jgi:hypothetical protein